MHAFITNIDYIRWQSCGEDVLMYIMAVDLLSCDRERLKILLRHLHNLKDT